MAATMVESARLFLLLLLIVAPAFVVRGQWLIKFDDVDEDYDFGGEGGDLLTLDYDEEDELGSKEEKPCPPPPSLRNGLTKVWGGGLLLTYTCGDAFSTVGPTHGACDLDTGRWTIKPPLCVEDKCPKLVAPNQGVVNMDVTGGVATFACRPGFYLIGSRVLLCEGGRWTGIYPLCVVNPEPASSTTPASTNVTTIAPVTEDLSILDSDETCFHNHIEPPVLEHAVVDISYVMNELRGRYVMLATYTCYAGYRMLNASANKLFCRNMAWGAAETPTCVPENDPCALNNGGCAHICVPGNYTYQCTCDTGYTLDVNAKDCVDLNECVIDNGGCQQDCHNTHASFFCSCRRGYVASGPTCIVFPTAYFATQSVTSLTDPERNF